MMISQYYIEDWRVT